MQKALPIIAGIVLAFALYVVPDMVANLGETLSFRTKGVIAIFLLLASIALEYKEKSKPATFALVSGIALALLLAFGGYIRMAELG